MQAYALQRARDCAMMHKQDTTQMRASCCCTHMSDVPNGTVARACLTSVHAAAVMHALATSRKVQVAALVHTRTLAACTARAHPPTEPLCKRDDVLMDMCLLPASAWLQPTTRVCWYMHARNPAYQMCVYAFALVHLPCTAYPQNTHQPAHTRRTNYTSIQAAGAQLLV